MKRIFLFGMLLASFLQEGFAQPEPGLTAMERIFDSPFKGFNRRYLLDLGKGNKVQIEIADLQDLEKFANADSILKVFIQDIEPLKDSLTDPLNNVRIDYILDSSGVKKIRLRQFQHSSTGFVNDHGEFSALKTEQDTIYLCGTLNYTLKTFGRKPWTEIRSYRMAIFINRVQELSGLLDGRINSKIQELIKNHNSLWEEKNGRHYLKSDPAISSRQNDGYFSGPGDYLVLNGWVGMENYKNYFTPSFGIGAVLITANTFFKREIGLFWEPHFIFANNTQGKLVGYRNDFLTLSLGQGPTKDNDPRKPSFLISILSIGYLINRNGDFFDKNSFRLMGGRLQLGDGKVYIEPSLYFHDFFKGVTPSIRFSLKF
jgi:hypothetical protein